MGKEITLLQARNAMSCGISRYARFKQSKFVFELLPSGHFSEYQDGYFIQYRESISGILQDGWILTNDKSRR